MSRRIIGSTPFYDQCDEWVDNPKVSGPLDPVDNPGEFVAQLERSDTALLRSLKMQVPGSPAFSTATLDRCPTCDQLHLLTVVNVQITVKGEGKRRKRKRLQARWLKTCC